MIYVRGSHGTITVDAATGMVVEYDNNCHCGEDYDDIVRFDPTDIARVGGDTDILALGYWTRCGHYEPPLTMRTVTGPIRMSNGKVYHANNDFDDWADFAVLPAPKQGTVH